MVEDVNKLCVNLVIYAEESNASDKHILDLMFSLSFTSPCFAYIWYSRICKRVEVKNERRGAVVHGIT